jgi:excisionase family DNA binding protein
MHAKKQRKWGKVLKSIYKIHVLVNSKLHFKVYFRLLMLTVAQAAEETGLSKVAIYKAIKSGRLSTTQTDNGQNRIDPAELFRVFKPVNKLNSKQVYESLLTKDNHSIEKELEFTQKMLRQVESERDNLRHSVDSLQRSLNQAMTLITHQPAQENIKPENQPVKVKSLLFEKLFGRDRH